MFIPFFHKHSDVRIALVEPNVRVAVYTHTTQKAFLVELDSEHNFVAEKETFCLHYASKCYIFRWNMDPCYASVMIVRSVYTNFRWYTVKHWSRLSFGCQLCTSKRSRSVMSSYMCSVQFTEQIKKAGRYSGICWWVRNDYTICIVNVRSEKCSIDLFITFVYLFSVLCVFCVSAFCICFSVVFVLFG